MKNNDSAAMYRGNITIAEENRVRGFDPLRFLEMTANGPKLALKIKQTWFRMKYPEGRIILRALNLTEQLALIEARVFLHKTDGTPQYTSQVQRMLNEVPGGLFVQAAQNAAVEQVLDEAGFTIRFSNAPTVAQTPTMASFEQFVKAEAKEETIPVSAAEPAPSVESVCAPVLESIPIPAVEVPATQTSSDTLPYTANTPVEEIIKQISVEEALNYVVTSGSCKGWTMAQALAKRPASVRFYTTPGYKGEDNILRASASIVLKDLERMAKAS